MPDIKDKNLITIDEVHDILDELAEELPQEFYDELNGGIILLPETHESEYSLEGDLYTLGEYHSGGPLGSYITIYYGSFVRLFPHLGREQMKTELRKTLRHEFRHHIETLAGEDDLVDEDHAYLQRYLASYGNDGKNR
ncbi:MAG: metallopeptidase family protein [Clostridiales Family XIII bacterium]|jgi:predicted Zn-dependent protease with MMP-like domain|nr:metallopeptidase family protein [Clostridiales Family XIII bacterium]